MNHHYIEYMTRERRREEMQECKRRQLLANSRSKKQMADSLVLKKLIGRVYFMGKATYKVALLNILAIKAKG